MKILARKFDQNKMTVDTVLPTCQEEASDAQGLLHLAIGRNAGMQASGQQMKGLPLGLGLAL